MNYSRAAVDSLRTTARELEKRAVELRRVADVLDGELAARDAETPTAPPRGRSLIPSEGTPGSELQKARCSGCPERPRCPNIVVRRRVRKDLKCPACINAMHAEKIKLAQAKHIRDRAEPAERNGRTLKSVCCSGCPQRPNCPTVLKLYRANTENHCLDCVVSQQKAKAHRYQILKYGEPPPQSQVCMARRRGSELGSSVFP